MDFQRSLIKESTANYNRTALTEISDENMLRDSDSNNNNNNNENGDEADSTLTPVVDMIESESDASRANAYDVEQYSPVKNNSITVAVDDACNSNLVTSTSDEPVVPVSKLNNIQDIFKEAKTSNVNVIAAAEMEANNDICFDSDKFPKKERRRNIADANYYDGVFQNVDSLNNKESASWIGNDSSIDSLDLKRIKVNHLHKDKVSE